METKFVIVCYDIPDTKVRNRLIHLLFACGFSRIQYSVFSGVIPPLRLSRMTEYVQDNFAGDENRILIMPLCRTCISQANYVNMTLTTEARSYFVV